MAVGKAGEKADRDKLGDQHRRRRRSPQRASAAPDYDETPVAAHIKGRDIRIAVDVGVGKGRRGSGPAT